MLSRTAGLCCSGAVSLTLSAGRPTFHNIPVPLGFDVDFQRGSSQLSLFKAGKNSAVHVHCSVPPSMVKSAKGGAVQRKPAPKTAKVRRHSSTSASPVNFVCGITLGKSLGPFHVEVMCHALLEQLVIDGVCFNKGPVELAPGPSRSPSQLTYRGPNISQAFLAEAVANQQRSCSPLRKPPQAAADPFCEWTNDVASPHHSFGHMPIHTVNPRLADGISNLLCAFGVDDELARFMQHAAAAVQKEERLIWRNLIRKEFC